jgi:hypothetical protein
MTDTKVLGSCTDIRTKKILTEPITAQFAAPKKLIWGYYRGVFFFILISGP